MKALVIAALVACARVAAADDVQPKPWAEGVALDKQHEAEAIFAEGNTLFAEQSHAAALDKYRAALAIWDHPLIRFNLAVTLIRLDRVLEAADDLERALRFGAAPFKPELYEQALDYQRLLAGRIGTLSVSCDQPDARVQLDGKSWLACPGQKTERTLVGEHTVVAERRGYLTSSRRLVVTGGATVKHAVELVSLDKAVVLEYRYPRWIPWTVLGAGAAITLGGAATWFVGRGEMNDFDNEFAQECSVTGCEHDLANHPALRAPRDAALLKRTIAITMMIAGGATTVGGVVLTIANRPRRVLPIEVAPSSGGAMAVFHGTF